MLVTATPSSFIKKRYALSEAKQAYEDLGNETRDKLMAIARSFGWNINANTQSKIHFEFQLAFNDYLRNTTQLKEAKWKLVNRPLIGGMVFLTKNEATRLLSEEIRKRIEKRLETKELPTLPEEITESAERMKQLCLDKIGKTEMEGLPQVMVQNAFPPCISALYQAFTSGRHLSHIGRFTLTSFLVNAGMPTDKVAELFRNFSDFNEKMTRYQVEHIAGEQGSRTRYIPPKCETLKTHGVCENPDDLCKRVRHPLAYYKRMAKTKIPNVSSS